MSSRIQRRVLEPCWPEHRDFVVEEVKHLGRVLIHKTRDNLPRCGSLYIACRVLQTPLQQAVQESRQRRHRNGVLLLSYQSDT